MPELILLIRVAEDPRGELRASTVREPRAAPAAHVARSASAGASVFNNCAQRETTGTRDSSSGMRKETRGRRRRKGTAWLFEAYLSPRNPTPAWLMTQFFVNKIIVDIAVIGFRSRHATKRQRKILIVT